MLQTSHPVIPPVLPPRGGRGNPYRAAALPPLLLPSLIVARGTVRQGLASAGGGGNRIIPSRVGDGRGAPSSGQGAALSSVASMAAPGLGSVCPAGGGGRGWGRAAVGNPRSPSPRLSTAGGGGLAFGCGGAQVCAVSPDYAICLVSPAATMASLGWSPAWGRINAAVLGSLLGEDEDCRGLTFMIWPEC
ncbi:hypothetical protein QYE76_044332 [Lolium multiflorum]|uniref:Uncharacterized protein n=1 Tax=Lolium multiflorum TaxID=4521 RepID=A0AAD8TIK9_LOLMU|nr:hypothetical protein QYE76_044332 [Lolium multiflorum]